MNWANSDLGNAVRQSAGIVATIKNEVSRVIVGQDHMIETAILALLTGGHILLEGVPGLAKTLLCNTLAQVIDCQFRRIQFTPDLLPADLTGSLAYRQSDGTFYAKKGPIFANLVLADEINRAPAKVQSALLEAMQEKQVTIGDESFPLPRPFLVIATQNPIDQEGTYALPEAQVDRFMLKVVVDYPSIEEEKQILVRMTESDRVVPKAVTTANGLIAAANTVRSSVYIDERLQDYIVRIVYATREPERFDIPKLRSCIARGASPRATLAFAHAARAYAFMHMRAFTTPDDIKDLAIDVLQHRIALTYEAQADNMTPRDIIEAILSKVSAP